MSKPLTIADIEFKLRYLEQIRIDLLNNKCEEGALSIGGLIHAYKKVLGTADINGE